MNKKLLAIIVALILIIIGIIFLVTSKKTGNQIQQTENNQQTGINPTQPVSAQPKSLKDLLTMGVSQKCTFTKNEKDVSSTVTVYMDNGQVRGDINSVSTGQTINSHMIIQGTETYVWMEGQKSGFKMAFNSNPQGTTPAPAQNNSVNPDEKVDYNCSPWTADKSVFNLPADVQFSDFSTMAIPSVSVPSGGSKTGGTTDKCAACNYLSGGAKTQCLTALGCN